MVAVLDQHDAKLRYEVVAQGFLVVNNEEMHVPVYDDGVIVAFVSDYYDLQGIDTRIARKLLGWEIRGGSVYQWVKRNYSHERLHAMYEFSNYCGWLIPKEIIQHFGKNTLCMFRALQGDPPKWCTDVPFHLVLKVAFIRRNAEVRKDTIEEYLIYHWDEAVAYFGGLDFTPEHMNSVCDDTGLIEVKHVFSVFKRWERQDEESRVREYMRKHKKEDKTDA